MNIQAWDGIIHQSKALAEELSNRRFLPDNDRVKVASKVKEVEKQLKALSAKSLDPTRFSNEKQQCETYLKTVKVRLKHLSPTQMRQTNQKLYDAQLKSFQSRLNLVHSELKKANPKYSLEMKKEAKFLEKKIQTTNRLKELSS